MKRKFIGILALVAMFTAVLPTSAYAYRRVTIDRDNYAPQYERDNGRWLATARNFVVAQQRNTSEDSERVVEEQYDDVCYAVKRTTRDVTGNLNDQIDALYEFDEMLGTGSHDYEGRSGQKSFDFLFDEVAEYANPVALLLGPTEGSSSSVGHNVLLTGVDSGSNYTEFVRIYNSGGRNNEGEVVWTQFYDLENGTSDLLDGRNWIGTVWCE